MQVWSASCVDSPTFMPGYVHDGAQQIDSLDVRYVPFRYKWISSFSFETKKLKMVYARHPSKASVPKEVFVSWWIKTGDGCQLCYLARQLDVLLYIFALLFFTVLY